MKLWLIFRFNKKVTAGMCYLYALAVFFILVEILILH